MANTSEKFKPPVGWQPQPPFQPGYPSQQICSNPTYPIQPGYPIHASYPVQPVYSMRFPGGPGQNIPTTNPSPYMIAVDRSESSGGTPVYEPGHPTQTQSYDQESPKPNVPDNFGSSFSSREIRHKFIRKVYFLLTLQLLITVAIVAVFTLNQGVQKFVRDYKWMYPLAYAVFIITYLSLVCCNSVRRKFPANLILLTVFTLSMSYMLGTIASFHTTEIVLFAVGATTIICFLITLFAIQTKIDFTGWSIYLFVAVLILFIFGLIAAFTRSNTMHLIYSAGIVIVFSMYLIYDTQKIVGGRKYSLSPEEFIYATLHLYLDVVYIFLGILGISRSN